MKKVENFAIKILPLSDYIKQRKELQENGKCIICDSNGKRVKTNS